MAKNYYEELGVSRDATPEQIKKSYRKLARKYHPDVSKESDAESKMQAINVAYDTLSDSEKKKEYDFLLDHPQGFQGAGAGQGDFDQSQFYRQQQGFDSSNFQGFEDLFGRFGSGFGGSDFRYQRERSSYRGEDQHASIEVEPIIAYQGSTQSITLQIPTVNAYGQPEVQRKTLQVKIPKGMKEGQQIRLSGQGQSGINGGENGDLYIEIHYASNAELRVEGADVFMNVNISPWEAALGQSIQVNTSSGKLSVQVPANAKNGQQLRLKDRGVPAKTPGHLYLVLNIVVPQATTEQQKQAYQNLADHFASFEPRA